MLRYFRCHRDKKNGKNTGVLDTLRGRLLIKNTVSDDSANMAGHTWGFQAPSLSKECPSGYLGQSRSSLAAQPPRKQSARCCVQARPHAPCPGRMGTERQQGQFTMLVLLFLQRWEATSGTVSLYVHDCGTRGSGRNNLACAVIASLSALPL